MEVQVLVVQEPVVHRLEEVAEAAVVVEEVEAVVRGGNYVNF